MKDVGLEVAIICDFVITYLSYLSYFVTFNLLLYFCFELVEAIYNGVISILERMIKGIRQGSPPPVYQKHVLLLK